MSGCCFQFSVNVVFRFVHLFGFCIVLFCLSFSVLDSLVLCISVFCNLLPIFGNLVIISIDYKMLVVCMFRLFKLMVCNYNLTIILITFLMRNHQRWFP